MSDGNSSGWIAPDVTFVDGDRAAPREHSSRRTLAASAVSPRIVALDLLRGYFLFMMIVDHLGRFPNLFDLLTGRNRMWASAAEGFFFISGMVVAIARNRDADSYGFRNATVKMWKKAGALYLWSVALTLVFTYLVFAVGEHHTGMKAGIIDREPFGRILYQAATFQYSYGWADFLPYYTLFLLGAPLVLWFLRRKQWWVAAIASAAVWLSSDRFELCWQVLFAAGMISGFYLPAAEQWFHHLDRRVRRLLIVALTGLAALTGLVSASFVYLQPRVAMLGWRAADELRRWDDRLAPHFDKGVLPLPRLLVFGLWFTVLYLIFRRYEVGIRRYLGWFLLPMGLLSLFTYILHGFVIFVVALTIPETGSLQGNFATTAGCLLVIWAMTASVRVALQPPRKAN